MYNRKTDKNMVDKVLKVFSSYHAFTSLERSQTAVNMDIIKKLFGVLLFVYLFCIEEDKV